MRRMRFEHALLPAVLAALAPGCGTEAGSGSEVTFESWRTSVCSILTSSSRAATSPPPLPDDDGAFDAFMRRNSQAWRKAAADIRALQLPEDRHHDTERFVELNVDIAEAYAAALPRIEAASREWERVLKTIDPDTLEPKAEGETVVGSIMTQVLAVPAAREAMMELERAQAAARSVANEREAERLTVELGLSDCESAP